MVQPYGFVDFRFNSFLASVRLIKTIRVRRGWSKNPSRCQKSLIVLGGGGRVKKGYTAVGIVT
jgi:hypothetical protein